jgi:NAD+ synthase (glutamine-hydrolysing)
MKSIISITMPGFGTTERTFSNSTELCGEIGTDFRQIDIKDVCLKHFRDIGHDPATRDVTYENVQARERTQILMDIANKEKGLVIGTGDLSEMALGWSTYNGDHMSMYAVNCSVPKTLIRYLINWLADNSRKKLRDILLDIIETPVSPELLPSDTDSGISQRTEDILGPYELHDFFLYHMIKYGAHPEKIKYLALKAFGGKYTSDKIKKYLTLFMKRFFSNQFKRTCVPDGPKVGTISLSPRGDWRMPADASSTLWLK